MITTEQWRISIGCFKPTSTGKNIVEMFESDFFNNVFQKLTFEKLFVVLMMLLCNLNMSFLIIMKLIVDGEVESNPGPTYNIAKIVKASFHQGSPMFDATAGIQCACNALYAICWNKI